MLASLHQTRTNLEAELTATLGSDLAAAIAEKFVAAVAGRRRKIENAAGAPIAAA
jgi:hypothetical protein